MQVLEELEATTRAALSLVGPRMVTALVVRAAVKHAQRHGLQPGEPPPDGNPFTVER